MNEYEDIEYDKAEQLTKAIVTFIDVLKKRKFESEEIFASLYVFLLTSAIQAGFEKDQFLHVISERWDFITRFQSEGHIL